MQKGYIYQTNGAWHVRYRVDGKQVSRKLADYNDQYRTKRGVRPLADEGLDPLNQGLQVNGPMTVQQSAETVYLSKAEEEDRKLILYMAQKMPNRWIRFDCAESSRSFPMGLRDSL